MDLTFDSETILLSPHVRQHFSSSFSGNGDHGDQAMFPRSWLVPSRKNSFLSGTENCDENLHSFGIRFSVYHA
jgi:hypothetical protein